MKRLLLATLLSVVSMTIATAQPGHFQLSLSSNIGPNNHFVLLDNKYAPNMDIKTAYLFDVGSHLKLGAGTGVGLSTVISYETTGFVKDDGVVESIGNSVLPSIPVFAIAKMNYKKESSTPFFKVEVGHRFARMDDSYKGHFNPYLFNVIPSIGYDFAIGKHKLGLELGAEWISFKKTYQPAESDYLLSGGRMDLSADNFNGAYFAMTYIF